MPTTPSYQNNAAPYAAPELVDNEEESPDARRPKPLYMSNPFIKAALVKGNFKTIVAQPRYCDLNEVCQSLLPPYCLLLITFDASVGCCE